MTIMRDASRPALTRSDSQMLSSRSTSNDSTRVSRPAAAGAGRTRSVQPTTSGSVTTAPPNCLAKYTWIATEASSSQEPL